MVTPIFDVGVALAIGKVVSTIFLGQDKSAKSVKISTLKIWCYTIAYNCLMQILMPLSSHSIHSLR